MLINYLNIGWDSFIGFKCSYCETILTKENLSKDHVIPKAARINLGGEGNNTTASCKDCNHKKGDSSLLFFLGFLPKDVTVSKKNIGWTINEKANSLAKICGLEVRIRKHKKETEYAFYINNQQIKSCFTYPKAKLFAEGYALGIKYGKL